MLKPLAANGLLGTAVGVKRVLSHAAAPAWQGRWVLKNYTATLELSV